ncbi:MAG: bacterial Ig-like domain-containing protein [Oscillospiraceae bacterium]|nr:bacterial Ig-like domain-containing protein [Oscillospiraceae bacterium]
MERLMLNSSILRQILNDREAIYELREFLNAVIDDELNNAENMDCDLIDECVNALEELDFEASFEKPHLAAIMSEEKFIKKIQSKSKLQADRYKKLIAICASAAILLAVGSVKTESGQTVVKTITNKIAAVFNIESADPKPEESTANEPKTEPTTVEPITETTTKATEPESEITTERPTETPTETPIKTVHAHKPPETTTKRPENPVTLQQIEGTLSKKAKTDYLLGEELDLSGVQITALYSDGSKKQIPLDECRVSVPEKFSKAVGRYKVTVSYQGKSFTYTVSVYAEKTSAILNSIYGTFPEGYDFKVESFDDLDFSEMTVTAVYSDGTETLIPLSECEITVEKNFMELENKALVTVTYEERSFSFVLTKEEQ